MNEEEKSEAVSIAQHYIDMECDDFMVEADGISIRSGVFQESKGEK